MLIKVYHSYQIFLKYLVHAFTIISGMAVLGMMLVTCLDVICRAFGSPIPGTLDIVRMLGAVTLACSLPYTTAVKGHVAIEYLFQKMPWLGRVTVDTVARLSVIVLFVVLGWNSLKYGFSLKSSGQVSATLQMPLFWIPWVIALSCLVVILVIFQNMIHPGREIIKP